MASRRGACLNVQIFILHVNLKLCNIGNSAYLGELPPFFVVERERGRQRLMQHADDNKALVEI